MYSYLCENCDIGNILSVIKMYKKWQTIIIFSGAFMN